LDSLPDEQSLLEKSLVLTPEHELHYFMAAGDGVWDVRRAELKQTEGFPFTGEVDRLVSTILVRCDGRRTLAEVVSQVAEQLHVDPEQTARSAVGVIRRLVQSGFLAAGPGEKETHA
jgi:predicted RNA-binding protein